MSPMVCVTRCTEFTISLMVWPAAATSCVPRSTRSTLVLIRPLISLAASADRPARERTSDATTAKPRPCSPARAASTAAFNARMLVWKAMPSMTLMMSAILDELVLISCMVATTSETTEPPRTATSAEVPASWLACWAALALFCTASVRRLTEWAVCCRLAAVCSVRLLKSRLPSATSWLERWMELAASRMLSTIWRRLFCMAVTACSRRPISSLAPWGTLVVRSPAAMRSVMRMASLTGCVTPTVMRQAMRPPATRATITSPPSSTIILRCKASDSALASWVCASCRAIRLAASLRKASSAGRTRFMSVSTAATVSPSLACLSASVTSGSTFLVCSEIRPIRARSSLLASAVASNALRAASAWLMLAMADSAALNSTCSCLGSSSVNRATERLWMVTRLMLSISVLVNSVCRLLTCTMCSSDLLTCRTEYTPVAATPSNSNRMAMKPRESLRANEEEEVDIGTFFLWKYALQGRAYGLSAAGSCSGNPWCAAGARPDCRRTRPCCNLPGCGHPHR